MKRNATAIWNGSGKEGSGNLSTQSGVLDKNQYSWKSRFADGIGTNPEELIAAAHAGCFSMKLSFVLGSKDLVPESIETECVVNLEDGKIVTSHLTVKAKVPGATAEVFAEAAEEAKRECPISKSLNTEISMEATLID